MTTTAAPSDANCFAMPAPIPFDAPSRPRLVLPTRRLAPRSPCRRGPKQERIEQLFSEAKPAFGRLDILVNNAGVYEFAPLEEVTEGLFHKHFDVNVLGLLLTTKEAVKHMGPEGGSVINIGSGASSMRPPNSTDRKSVV